MTATMATHSAAGESVIRVVGAATTNLSNITVDMPKRR